MRSIGAVSRSSFILSTGYFRKLLFCVVVAARPSPTAVEKHLSVDLESWLNVVDTFILGNFLFLSIDWVLLVVCDFGGFYSPFVSERFMLVSEGIFYTRPKLWLRS